jgi:transposase
MTTNTIAESASDLTQPPFAAWIGLDWGHKENAFALQPRSGPGEEGIIPQTAETLHQWLRDLGQRFGARPVAIGLETKRGAIIHALLEYPWLTIYPINPMTSARYRTAFTPSGASDDLPDARVLLELVRDHTDKLRPLEQEEAQTVQLGALNEARRKTVDRRTALTNELTSLLRSYYPQALQLVDKLNSELAQGFFKRWPDLIALKAAKPATLKKFYYAHNVRRPELVQKRLQLIRQAVALTTDQARVSVAVLQLRCLLDQLGVLAKHVARFEEQIKRLFADHPEAYLFRELPGAGPALAPRLCVAFGTVRTVYPAPSSLQKLAGVAPVREKSGQQLWTHWRWRAPKFLRQSFVEWVGQTVVHSAWAKVYYQRMEAKGKAHSTILRALAFKWIRVLWKCWQTRTPYDEARYLKQLLHRKSPNAVTS